MAKATQLVENIKGTSKKLLKRIFVGMKKPEFSWMVRAVSV
jgi:hypothetical protein